MGLDMYLTKTTYVGANHEHRKVSGVVSPTENTGTPHEKPIKVELNRISTIRERVGYWRKANAIHGWFVREVQDGVDECEENNVEYSKLPELRALCDRAINKDQSALEELKPTSGFFFGSTEVDQFFFEDLKNTIKIIDALDPDGDYSYCSSW